MQVPHGLIPREILRNRAESFLLPSRIGRFSGIWPEIIPGQAGFGDNLARPA
jgi:hypothetical protein